MSERLLTANEVMERLRISDRTKLAEIAASGNLPYIQHSDSKNAKRLFPESGVDAYLERQVVPPVKDITEKTAKLAEGLTPRDRDFFAPRNESLGDPLHKAKALLEKITRENHAELFWRKNLWETVCIIRKNLEALIDYSTRYDDEIFTAEFLKKLLIRNCCLWHNLIAPVIESEAGLNPKLLASALPAGKGLWVRTRKQDHEMGIGLEGNVFTVTNEWTPIPAPASPQNEKALFHRRWHYAIKIDKAGKPVNNDEQRRLDTEKKAKKIQAMRALAEEIE